MSRPHLLLVMEATDGGTGRYLRDVGHELLRIGHPLSIVCAARRNPAFRAVMTELETSGARVIEVDMRRPIDPPADAGSLLRLVRLFRKLDPDLIHLHSSKAGALGRLAARWAGKGPVVYTPHAFSFLDASSRWRSRLYLAIERLLGPLTDHLVAVSGSERDQALRRGLAAPGKITVVENGVRLPRTGAGMPCSDGRQGVRIGALGRLDPQKDPLKLIETAWRLKERGIRFELHIGGTGSLHRACLKLVEEKGLEGDVRIMGWVGDVAGFYESLDVFMVASRYEGLPYTVLDAMAHGLPVLGFEAPGVSDLVLQGTTGLLAPPGDVDVLAGHAARLIGNPGLRQEMGRAGRARIEASFTLESQVQKLARVYETLT